MLHAYANFTCTITPYHKLSPNSGAKTEIRERETAHLADMISENWLILRAPNLPLEPRLRLPIVGDLQCGCTVANLWQIRHGVSDRDRSVDSPIASVERQTFVQS